MFELILILCVSLFFLLGTFISFMFESNHKFIYFSMSIAFGVMVSLALFDLLPETVEVLGNKMYLLILGIILGLVLTKVLDIFIPDHDDNSDQNLFHIGIIAGIALGIHNIIEGMALYTTLTASMHLGLLLGVGIILHNVPLGMVISSTFYNISKGKTIVLSLIIAMSTFIGGLLMFILNGLIISETFLGFLLSLTIGMIGYITIFELFPKIIKSKYPKLCSLGVGIGLLLLFITNLFNV